MNSVFPKRGIEGDVSFLNRKDKKTGQVAENTKLF